MPTLEDVKGACPSSINPIMGDLDAAMSTVRRRAPKVYDSIVLLADLFDDDASFAALHIAFWLGAAYGGLWGRKGLG